MARSAARVWIPESNTTEAIVVDLEYSLPSQMVNSPPKPLVDVASKPYVSPVLGLCDPRLIRRFRGHLSAARQKSTRDAEF